MSDAQELWVAVSVPGHDDLNPIQVQVLNDSPEELEEAKAYARSLADHQKIEGRPGQPALRATHAIVTLEDGERRLVRKRYTAF